MQEKLNEILAKFNKSGNLLDIKTFTSGHINSTYYLKMEIKGKIKEFVLQRINHNVFKKPDEVMENIATVTNHIKQKIWASGGHTSRRVLKFYPSNNGKYFCQDENGDYWRIYKYITNSKTFNSTDSLKVLTETGKAFGEFQLLLDDFPIQNLNITIPHFHNTKNRYKNFYNTLEQNPVGRAENVQDLISQYLKLEKLATKMYGMQQKGELGLRVTHNDTKCNNVLFDTDTNSKLCVIDLDTVMPGLVGFDFGDAIRFGANSCKEDERDISKVHIDLDKFQAFTKGFLSEVASSLTENEKKSLSLGAITMTVECGLRFLTDYLDGDNYFKISYPEHNLDRAKCQLALAKDMIKNYNKMQEIVQQYCKEYNC